MNGVFYYPEGLLIARKQEVQKTTVDHTITEEIIEVEDHTGLNKRRLEDKVSVRITQYGETMKKNLQYATGATMLILLYALL